MNGERLTDDQWAELSAWLEADGYASVEEWAEDSDYYQKDGEWFSRGLGGEFEDHPVGDIEVNCWFAMEASVDDPEKQAVAEVNSLRDEVEREMVATQVADLIERGYIVPVQHKDVGGLYCLNHKILPLVEKKRGLA